MECPPRVPGFNPTCDNYSHTILGDYIMAPNSDEADGWLSRQEYIDGSRAVPMSMVV